MFTCIGCTKQVGEEEDDESRATGGARVGCSSDGSGTPNTEESIKTLTAQIKDMALKVSGAYRQCNPCTPSRSSTKRPYPHFDSNSEGVPFPYMGGSSTSTPAWDFTRTGNYPATRSDARLASAFGGDCTPRSLSVSGQSCDVFLEDAGEPKEWTAQVEPGVHITFLSLLNGGNDLKRIRFSRDMFDKLQAQQWWGENFDRIMELYNVQKFNQAVNTPARSEDERDSSFRRTETSWENPMNHKDWNARNHQIASGSKIHISSASLDHGGFPQNNASYGAYGTGGHKVEPSVDASRTTTSSRDDASVSISNASDIDVEWVQQDEPGVYITIRQLLDGTRELRRVRFSREMFGEVNAKLWWEENRERIQAQYL